jgi:hypothetical protein
MRIVTYVAAVLLLILGNTRQTSAAIISAGSRIDISPTTFAIPIDISDGQEVFSWQFDLTYDPSDVQINAGCDPFGDQYCSLLTGPVTEGDFFSAGAPFNLLDPGFIDLDPVTFAQTGLLFGVNGTFGGSLPFPSGNGTLAFVEFTLLGTGGSPIRVTGSAGSVSAVPEPGTLALLLTGFVLPRGWRAWRRVGRQQSVR